MPDAATAAETKTERSRRIRLKWFTSVMTNVGYGVFAVGVVQPIFKQERITGVSLLGFALGLFCFAVAVYTAPLGEKR